MDKMRAMSTPPTKVSFKEQMHLAREEAILQATCRLLGEKAYDAMTMDDVANAVGIAKASLYKHFSSKEELCSAAMVQILARVRTYLDGLAAEMPPVEKLQALVRWSLERLITNEMPLLPSRNSSLRAVSAGCGVGVMPELLARGPIADGSLVDLVPGHFLPIQLYWHCWNLESELLDALTEALKATAANTLVT